jgi:hypothetical protein
VASCDGDGQSEAFQASAAPVDLDLPRRCERRRGFSLRRGAKERGRYRTWNKGLSLTDSMATAEI